MKQIIFYFILLVNTLQIACSQNKEQVIVEQVPSKYSTILYANIEKDKIEGAKFYLTFDITKNTNEEIRVGIPEYGYKGKFSRDLFKGWRTPIPIYLNYNDKFEIALGNKDVEGLGRLDKVPKQYILPTSHRISQDSLIQSMFSSYLEKMKIENKDTLHIGTITELKKRNSPILQLLEGDSIIFSFDRNDIYRDPIAVQIK